MTWLIIFPYNVLQGHILSSYGSYVLKILRLICNDFVLNGYHYVLKSKKETGREWKVERETMD